MKDCILNYYEEYKKFMCLEKDILPAINPVELSVEDTENVYAYVDVDNVKKSVVDVYYRSDLSNKKIIFQKSKLFHEFTHILDAVTIFANYQGKEFRLLMHTYSEYNASQIELACGIGMKSIKALLQIDLRYIKAYNNENAVNIESDYICHLADAAVIINQSLDDYCNLTEYEYYSKYKNFETKTMYYLGKKNFCSMISSVKIADITSKTYGDFYPFIYEIEQAIIKKDFDRLISAREKLWQK